MTMGRAAFVKAAHKKYVARGASSRGDNVVVVERGGQHGFSDAPVPTGIRGGRHSSAASGFSLSDPVVKFGAVAGILLIGSGLLMKTYRKYFPGDSAVGDALSDPLADAGAAAATAGDAVSDVAGDVFEEVGETLASVPYRFAHGVYGVAQTAAADVYRWFLASGDSAAEAGRKTQAWIDSQVADAGAAALDLVGLGDDDADADADAFFGGGSANPDLGFGGSWDDDVTPTPVVPTPVVPTPYAPDPSQGLGALQDIYLDVYGHLPEGVDYAGSRDYPGCTDVCQWQGRGMSAHLVCTSMCPTRSDYAGFIADHLSVVPAGGVYGPPAGGVYGPPAPVESAATVAAAVTTPSGAPGMPDYS